QFFYKDGNLVFCNDVQGLKKCFDIEYDPSEWRLFIYSSKTSLKAILMHIGNSFASLPLGHSVHLEENYNDLSMILEKIMSRDLHWTKSDWSLRGALTPGEKNVINTTLLPPEKVLSPPLHIKLGFMKQFIKSLPKYGECFRYLCSKFPKLSEVKLKEGVFTGPGIRKLLSDSLFSETMGDKEKRSVELF
ncbi:hypothetical protein AVEN_218456-1, partial [Araneus ventricosus]